MLKIHYFSDHTVRLAELTSTDLTGTELICWLFTEGLIIWKYWTLYLYITVL